MVHWHRTTILTKTKTNKTKQNATEWDRLICIRGGEGGEIPPPRALLRCRWKKILFVPEATTPPPPQPHPRFPGKEVVPVRIHVSISRLTWTYTCKNFNLTFALISNEWKKYNTVNIIVMRVIYLRLSKKHVMYKVGYHGNDQEMKVKMSVFVKYGIVPV